MSRPPSAAQLHQKSKTLNDKYLLGDEIGKGAYGRVYKGLDLENGDFVAIKQVSLENIPPEDLASIMQEIDLLKNLNHKNIVKYLGSFKTKSHLYIILEYVENGSLASIIKPNKFGAFPESLVAVYIAQVLEGLVYLHEQGVIHRDIKGANILTTKEGLVKLADFGVATKLTEADVNTHSVVGTPYWMAPEVIEMSGVSAASDIWSVGCTVIELLTCVPPYYDLQPMPALFRIVQDEHPPIPEHLLPETTDFLYQCFRKDAKQRPDAKTLLKHPWIQMSRKALHSMRHTGERTRTVVDEPSRVLGKTADAENASSALTLQDEERNKYSPRTSLDARATVSNGNDVVKQENMLEVLHQAKEQLSNDSTAVSKPEMVSASLKGELPATAGDPTSSHVTVEYKQSQPLDAQVVSQTGISRPSAVLPSASGAAATISLVPSEGQISLPDGEPRMPRAELNGTHFPSQAKKLSAISSTGELSKFSDSPADGVLDDLFEESLIKHQGSVGDEASTSGPTTDPVLHPSSTSVSNENGNMSLAATLKARMAQKRVEVDKGFPMKQNQEELFSHLLHAAEEDEIDIRGLGLDDQVQGRNFHPKQVAEVSRLIGVLKSEKPEDAVVQACHRLVFIFKEYPDQKSHLISQHGLMPFIELLDGKNEQIIEAVLQVINQLAKDNKSFQENLCLVGLIPCIINFAGIDYSKTMRMQTAVLIQQLCQTSALTLQMYIASRGLPALVGFLEPDYAKYRDMVHIAVDCIWEVFRLDCPTPVNDFCRIFAKSGILMRLVNTLHNLNEASRLAPAAASTTSEGGAATTRISRSGPVEPSRPFSGQIENFHPRSAQLDPSHIRSANNEKFIATDDSLRQQNGSSLKNQLVQSETRQHPGPPISSFFQQASSENGWQTDQPFLFEVDKEHFDFGHSDLAPLFSDQTRPLLGHPENLKTRNDQTWQYGLDEVARSSQSQQIHPQAQEPVQPLLSLLEKDPLSRPVSGQLEYIRHLQGGLDRHESILPLLHHASAFRKNNGELDMLMSAFEDADNVKDNATIELTQASGGKSFPMASVVPDGGLGNSGNKTASTPELVSQSASGVLSISGIFNGRSGSVTSSGVLSRMPSSLNADAARVYLEKVADLLLEFSRADTAVKSLCSVGLLIRLFQMLSKLESSILLKVLKCINQLSADPFTLENLQRAEAMKHLVPFLELREGPMVSPVHNEVLNALYNLCKINKRRQEQAAECGIIPQLMYFINIGSSLKQFALPLLCDMAHASRYTREQLRIHKGIELYLTLLDDGDWAVTALDSLAVCVAFDNEQRKVEQILLRPEAIHKLVTFFQSCNEQSFVHILEPFLKIITKSPRINVNLATSGLTPLLVARLDHRDAIARLNLLKLIKAVYEHHPRPKQLIVEYSLPEKLQRLIDERRDGERSGGQVLVKQMATSLLKALHINIVL